MFETSFLLFTKALLYNILLPLVPGIFFLRIFFGKKVHGVLLYLLWWFVWVGVVSFSLFNLQFVHFGIGVPEYTFLLVLLTLIFVSKLIYRKLSFHEYLATLATKNISSRIQQSFWDLSLTERIFSFVLALLGLSLLTITFIHTTNFPTYADDSFANRNGPAYNIYLDGWVKMFGDKTEILGRWRLWYPIYIPLYKALVSDFMWWFNDIYINMWQWLCFLGIVLFVFMITFTETRNVFYSLLPIGLICSLPLIYFHAVEWYMELPCAVYSILTIWAFWKFLEEKEYTYISLALLLGFILSHMKYDGLLWYFVWIIISFLIILSISGHFKTFLYWIRKDKQTIYFSLFCFLFFLFPFLLVRSMNHLWLNPSAIDKWWIALSQVTHREIFSVFPWMFMSMDNYNVVLIIILLLILSFWYQKKNLNKYFLLMSGITSFIIFVLVFLLTENYQWVMNQTTVNRVFTMCFVMILAFAGILLHKHRQTDE